MSDYKNIRIKDIAEMAGVSVATVDRVLHHRGKISEKAMKKVLEVLDHTGYKPNLIASTLGTNKLYKIAALIPDPVLDDYWNQSGAGIFKAKEEWSQYNVRIESFYFNLYEKSSFREVAGKVLDFEPDSMLIAPIFYKEAMDFFRILKEEKIPYILFNTNIPDAEPISFIGQDLYQSGRVAAEMLASRIQHADNIAVLHIYEDIQNAVHLREKERGFRDFFREHGANDSLIQSFDLEPSSGADFDRELYHIIQKNSPAGLFVSTSKGCYMAAAVLDRYGKKDVIMVGYDLLKDNIHYMYEGLIHFLINQNPKKQAFLGISYLVNYLLFKRQPPVTDLFPLEIITRENLKSYLHADLH